MKVILTEDVKSLGKKGEIVEVSDGYARNFILKKKKGLEANSKNLNDLKLKKANEDRIAQEQYEAAKELERRSRQGRLRWRSKREKEARHLALYLPRKSPRRLSHRWISISTRKKYKSRANQEAGNPYGIHKAAPESYGRP